MTQSNLKPRVLAMVLAGGEGTRLAPLTLERSKPAVPFGGRYRIVDFALSNLINSGIYSIYLLVQYKSQSLIEHINRSWALADSSRQFVTVATANARRTEWFQGTADAVYQNLKSIDYTTSRSGRHLQVPTTAPDVGANGGLHQRVYSRHGGALGSDRARWRDSASSMPPARRVRAFLKRPSELPPFLTTTHYASMGNYLFDTDVCGGPETRERVNESDFGG
jgi:glucose-1-phosphate adenylyltransferase